MAWIDRQGRLWGKVSLLDLGALFIVLVAAIAVFLLPGQRATSVVQVGNAELIPVEVDLISRGISARSLDTFKTGTKANLIIRNQPYGEVEVTKVENVTRTIPLVFPDGTVKNIPDREAYRLDLVVTLSGQGQKTKDGVVLGNNKVKIGVPLEIETFDYDLRGSVMDVRILTKAPA